MSLIPGISSQKTKLIDGVEVDYISELTAGSGVQLQGRTNAVAIEAGKPGEVLVDYYSASLGADTAGIVMTTRVLPAGAWALVLTINLGTQGAVATAMRTAYRIKVGGALPFNKYGRDKGSAMFDSTNWAGTGGNLSTLYCAGVNTTGATITAEIDVYAKSWALGAMFADATMQYIRIA